MGWHFPWVTSFYSNFLKILWWNMQGEKYSGLSRHLWVILDCFFYLQIKTVTKDSFLKAVARTEALIQRVIKAVLIYSGSPNLSGNQAIFLPTYTHLEKFIYCISPSFAILRHASFKNLIKFFSWVLEHYCAICELVAPHWLHGGENQPQTGNSKNTAFTY